MAANTVSIVDILTIPLASGAAITVDTDVGVINGTFTCAAVSSVTGTKAIGKAMSTVNQATGDTVVQVRLYQPITVRYYTNAASPNNVVLSTDFLWRVNFANATTVTKAANNGSGITYSKAGLVIDVSATLGVGVANFGVFGIDALS